MDKKHCISDCYDINPDVNERLFLHPFLGPMVVGKDKKTVCCKYDFENEILLVKCDENTSIEKDPINSFKNPIKPENYLSSYFQLKTMDDIIEHLKKNDDLTFEYKSRLIDFTFMTYKDDIEKNIIKWIELIKVLFDDGYGDKLIVKVLKKINSNKLDNNNYPFNLLLKIKKFLEYNI